MDRWMDRWMDGRMDRWIETSYTRVIHIPELFFEKIVVRSEDLHHLMKRLLSI